MAVIRRKRRIKPGWYLIGAVVLLIAFLAMSRAGRDLFTIWQISRMKAAEQKILDNDKARIGELEREIERLTTDSTYIEEIAREKYGMIRKGEEVFHLPRTDSTRTEK